MPGLHDQLQSKLLPGFTTGHTRYVQFIKDEFKDGCRWLDAGGGRRIFPDLEDGERDLVRRANIVTVCDADPLTLKDHVSVSNLIYCDLANIPLSSNSMDFITCAMVVEHLSAPTACLGELARILCVGGRLIIHTPNLWGDLLSMQQRSNDLELARRRRAGGRGDSLLEPRAALQVVPPCLRPGIELY
jgi:SAM-dependent methyltransferase